MVHAAGDDGHGLSGCILLRSVVEVSVDGGGLASPVSEVPAGTA